MTTDLISLKSQIDASLNSILSKESQLLADIDSELLPVANALSDYILGGGKRIRPIFALVGYLGAGGKLSEPIIKAVSSLEFLQACALIHDDLIDGSDSRRGKPSIHKAFEERHLKLKLTGNSEAYGQAAAVLLGDLALVWADKCINESGISQLQQTLVNPFHDLMRIEIMAGQYLDVLEQTTKDSSVERALKIARFKSGKYTIERPLHFGGALAEPKNLTEILSIYSEYGLPLGEAFQMRDDLLGVFGDPNETGKPAGDDLREGKRTALIAFTFDRIAKTEAAKLSSILGNPKLNPNEIEEAREIIEKSGAKNHVEELIVKLADQALLAINREEINLEAKKLMSELVSVATNRIN